MKTYTEKQAAQMGGIYTADELAVMLNLRPYEDPEGGKCFYDDNYEYVEQTALGNYAYKRDLIYHGDYRLESRTGVKIDINAVLESENFQPFLDEAFTDSYRAWLRTLETVANRVFERIGVHVESVKRVGENGIYDSFEFAPDNRGWKEIARFAFEEDSYFKSLTEWTQNYGSTYRSACVKFLENHGWHNWINDRDVESKFNNYLDHYSY